MSETPFSKSPYTLFSDHPRTRVEHNRVATAVVYCEANFGAVDGKTANHDLTCLALNIYHEARGEPEKGKRAVAKVTLNRVRSKRFPNTICEAVYEQRWDKRRRRYVGAFAWTEFDALPPPKSKQWKKAWKAAETVYLNPESVQLKGALFYHATRIKPRWAKQKKRIKRIGRHIFYR